VEAEFCGSVILSYFEAAVLATLLEPGLPDGIF
jgi:hypothetical protein